MTISASAVKDLREMTGAGMMDCKKALTETNGNLEEAVDWLRKKGLASAAKKAGRVAAEGLVAIATGDKSAGMVEVNIETDFAAKNEKFVNFAREMADAALKDGQAIVDSDANKQKVTELVAGIGENANLRRAVKLSVPQGTVAAYMHSAAAPNLGRIGVLVALESSAPADKLAELGKQIAMHIAAAKPEALSRDQVDSSSLERERAVLTEQAKASGKPDAVIEKMVEGRIKKFYEETVLLEQQYVITGEGTVQDAIDAKAKELGAPIKLTAFTRFALGEGIEKEETDFAAEVQKAMAG